VREREPRGVQERAFEPLHCPNVTCHAAVHASVDGIADDRMADGAQVHANLVRPPRVNGHLAQRDAGQVERACDAGDGVPRVLGLGRHFLAIAWIATDCRIDAASCLHDPPHERDVFLFDLAIVELARQLLVCRVVLGDHHDARRAAVETVDDAGPHLSADAAQARQVMQQRIDQCARRMAGTGVHHHARGLVDDGEVLVLVDDLHRQRLARERGWFGVRQGDPDAIAVVERQVRASRPARHRDEATGDQLLQLRSRVSAEERRQEPIETFALLLG